MREPCCFLENVCVLWRRALVNLSLPHSSTEKESFKCVCVNVFVRRHLNEDRSKSETRVPSQSHGAAAMSFPALVARAPSARMGSFWNLVCESTTSVVDQPWYKSFCTATYHQPISERFRQNAFIHIHTLESKQKATSLQTRPWSLSYFGMVLLFSHSLRHHLVV